jgi:predicted glycoside hydrolase/deacetylase ChbG (UPF0249 family)
LGAAPDFVDGHQHVHQLPGVRSALLDVMADRYGPAAKHIGIRICIPMHWRGIKAAIIARTGASSLLRAAAASGHVINTDFAGVYNFSADANLPLLWRRWLEHLDGALPLIMCHVAVSSQETRNPDPIRAARLREFEWLASAELRDLLQRSGLNPVPWPPV